MDGTGSYTGSGRGEFIVDIATEAPAALAPTSAVITQAKIRVPGPIEVGSSPQQAPTSDCRIIINQLLPSLTLLTGPLGFLFCILNVITKIIDCVNAVPKCITELSPGPLLSALDELSKAIICLARLVPQLSMLLMLYDMLTLLVALLECVISSLQSIKALQQEISQALAEAGNDDELRAQLLVTQQNNTVMMNQTITITNPLVPLFATINLFLPLFGQPAVSLPSPWPPAVPDIDAVISVLTTLHDTLATIKVALGELIGG